MGARASLAIFVACLALCSTPQRRAAAADTAESPSPESAAATAEARRHFKLGIRLYQDTNYSGALAEFEAAYDQKPSPSSLQNTALCQKALFRYREAASTLSQLIARHGPELAEGERKAVADAILELEDLVGSIVVNVEPSEAKVTLDGRAVSIVELRAGVEVNVGEHTLVADLPGYVRLSRVISVASGQKKAAIELKLKASDGFLDISAKDPRAAIAVDGVTRAFHEWRGSVKPDTDHLVQVFREGYESYETNVTVGVGRTLQIRAPLSARISEELPEIVLEKPGSMPAPPPPRVPVGYYGVLGLGLLGLGQQPLELTGTRSKAVMATAGLRAGYRMWAPVAAELMFDYGVLKVDDAKSEGSDVRRSYSLKTARLGPNLRLMTTGKQFRFSSAMGVGIVHHRLQLDPVASDASLTGGQARGYDPYFLLELGVEWSIAHYLLGVELVTRIDGATSLNKSQVEGASRAFGSTNTLPLFGLSVHGGYSLW